MESSPLRAIPLLSISSPCRGILFYRYRERARGRLILEAEIVKKAGCGFDVYVYYNFLSLMYMLYKSKTFELLELLDIVGMFLWIL